jgi:hypothetical protein
VQTDCSAFFKSNTAQLRDLYAALSRIVGGESPMEHFWGRVAAAGAHLEDEFTNGVKASERVIPLPVKSRLLSESLRVAALRPGAMNAPEFCQLGGIVDDATCAAIGQSIDDLKTFADGQRGLVAGLEVDLARVIRSADREGISADTRADLDAQATGLRSEIAAKRAKIDQAERNIQAREDELAGYEIERAKLEAVKVA